MKSNRKKRIIAAVLCMVMVVSGNISALAGEESFADMPAAEETAEFSDTASPAGENITSQTEDVSSESVTYDESVDIAFSDGEEASETDPNTETAPDVGSETEPETENQTTPESGNESQGEAVPDLEDGTGTPEETEVLSEETELKQEFVDAEGNVIQRVTARIPAGTFAAETSAITMEVGYLDTDTENYLRTMMTECLPEGAELGSYVFFNIQFKVNGGMAEALQPITITIEGSNLAITDTKKANVFYFDPADPATAGDKDELAEIPQRSQLLESLQAAGESTENIEDYDLSEITFREDGTTDKIIFEGRRSTIYGCYVEEAKPAEETPEVPSEPEQPETPEQPADSEQPETASEIEIISDEVNLRTEPDETADNVTAVAYAGERYTLLESVQAGEALWYKIQYINLETGEAAELYVRSDFARIVDESIEVSDDETVGITEEPGLVTELSYEDESISVVVSAAEEGIIPDGVSLKVVPVTAENAETQVQYEEVAQHVEEKVTAEEKEVAGFLAYDIFLVDAEGNEIEPNGEVRVSMNYKEAAIPEKVAEVGIENTEVTVYHLEEDENGEIQNVVDMTAEESAETTVQTTETAEIQSAEFTTASFSVFTITWGWRRVNVTFVDYSGNVINLSDPIKYNIYLEKNDIFYFSEITPEGKNSKYYNITDSNGKKYTFYNAVNEWVKYGEGHRGTEITALRYEDKKVQWYDPSQKKWHGPDDKDQFYIVYTEDPKKSQLTTAETVDTSSLITMRMTDYNSAADGLDSALGGQYGDGSVKQGLVNPVLEDGYPVMSGGNSSLKKLFDEVGSQNVNLLFLKDTFEETGYYEYSSFENYAYLSQDGNFTVYDQIGTPESKNNAYYFQRGNFLPYSKIENDRYAKFGNLYDEDGNKLPESDPRYNEALYLADPSQTKEERFYFGMYLEAKFAQLKGGQVQNKKTGQWSDMIYEFNGDDDLWVYIDDVLVLDIGGEHDAHSGQINFATGDVHVNLGSGKVQATNIRALFKKAGKLPDGSRWDDNKADKFFNGNTFRDYTAHTMKMFYMERGAGASNLHMRFNLEMIPDGQIQVRKELAKETDPVKYGDVEFGFELYIEASNEDGQGTGTLKKVTAETLGAYEAVKRSAGGIETPLQMDENGRFYLKPEETAFINNIPMNLKYEVKEVNVESDYYDEVEITGTDVKESFSNDKENIKHDISSGEDTVSNRPMVTFINSCSAKNLRTLKIDKIMEAGQTSEDRFTIHVEMENSEGKLAPFNGDYRLVDEKNNTIDADGNQQDETYRLNTADGNISIKAGWQIYIYSILSDTEFSVKELLTDEQKEKYETPVYKLTEDDSKPLEEVKEPAEGMIQLEKDAHVQVINGYKGILTVQKKWFCLSDEQKPDHIYAGLYQKDSDGKITPKEYKKLSEPDWTASFTGLHMNGEYLVKELTQTEGTGDFTIDGVSYVGVDSGTELLINNTDFTVSYSPDTVHMTDAENSITITNTQVWQIVKRSSSNGNPRLSGAEFQLEKDGTVYHGTSDENGIVRWKDMNAPLQDGTYVLKETKAPNGYMLGAEWTIIVKDGLPKNITGTMGSGDPDKKLEGINFDGYLENGIVTVYYDNTPLYELPSTGGHGIFGYMMGGVVLMMAATLILYKMKDKGVWKS